MTDGFYHLLSFVVRYIQHPHRNHHQASVHDKSLVLSHSWPLVPSLSQHLLLGPDSLFVSSAGWGAAAVAVQCYLDASSSSWPWRKLEHHNNKSGRRLELFATKAQHIIVVMVGEALQLNVIGFRVQELVQ